MALVGRILTVNCGKGTGQQGATKEKTQESLAALCHALQPDIILLQEYR